MSRTTGCEVVDAAAAGGDGDASRAAESLVERRELRSQRAAWVVETRAIEPLPDFEELVPPHSALKYRDANVLRRSTSAPKWNTDPPSCDFPSKIAAISRKLPACCARREHGPALLSANQAARSVITTKCLCLTSYYSHVQVLAIVWRPACSYARRHRARTIDDTTRLPYSRFLKFATIVAIILGSTLGVGGQRHRAKLSSDLLSFEARRTHGARARHRARLAHGNRSARVAARPAASRDGSSDSAVLLANSSQISALAAERDVLSGDAACCAVHGCVELVDRGRSGSRGSGRTPPRPRRDPRCDRRRRHGRCRSIPASPRIRRWPEK